MKSQQIPPLILSYHAVSSSWPSALAVPESVLEAQLRLLRKRGYVGLTFAEWARRRLAGTLPRRSVAVTFDDGYASTLKAKPILDALSLPATVFPVVRFVDSGEPLHWPGIDEWRSSEYTHELQSLNWDQLEELTSAGWEVGSHTLSHPLLPALDQDALEAELHESRTAIASRVGACETIAYPYGEADARVALAAEGAGYLAGCTLTTFHTVDDAYRRVRVGLYQNDTGVRLRFKLSAAGLALRRSAWAATLLGRR